YKEMTPFLRWGLLPFLLLFTASAAVFGLRALERLLGRPTPIFDIDLRPILGFPGRLIDVVQFVNSAVLVTLLILAVPHYLVLPDAGHACADRQLRDHHARESPSREGRAVRGGSETDLRRGPIRGPLRVRPHPHPVPARGRWAVRDQYGDLAQTARLRAGAGR